MKKLRIGILCPDFNKLENWECRIFKEITRSNWGEIVVLIKDQRKKIKKNLIKKLLNSENIVNKILLKLIFYIENKIIKLKFGKKFNLNKNEKLEILYSFKKIKEIYLKPSHESKYVDYFNENDCEEIKNLNLDVLLRHEFKILKGKILSIPKHGVWSFHHGDNDVNRGGPPGFWEIMFNQQITGVTLQKLNEELDGGAIIEKGFYPTKKSFAYNQKFIYEKSVEIILKNLKLLHLTGSINLTASKPYNKKILTIPRNVSWIFKYTCVLLKIFNNKIKNFFTKFLGYRLNAWAIFFQKGKIISSNLSNSIYFKPNKNEFWADPFALDFNEKKYLFFENYSYKKNKGKICCATFFDGKIQNIQDALELDYHLSYPFVFALNDSIYMMPETIESKRLEIYRAIDFPIKWELFSTGFHGERIADPTLFIENKNKIWLFLNKSNDFSGDFNSELYIYKISDLKLQEITAHKLNPVIIDSRRARNAGNIFVNNGKIIRPSQFNIGSKYGFGLNLSEITNLSIDHYEEKLIKTFKPDFRDNLSGIHHLTQLKDEFFFDACFKKL